MYAGAREFRAESYYSRLRC